MKLKTIKKTVCLLMLLPSGLSAQNISAHSNEVSLDYSDAKKGYASSVPKIMWSVPENETTFLKDGKTKLVATVDSKQQLKSVVVTVREKDHSEPRGTLPIVITENKKYNIKIDKPLNLLDGINEIEIIAENIDGVKSITKRYVHVGNTVLADASKLKHNLFASV